MSSSAINWQKGDEGVFAERSVVDRLHDEDSNPLYFGNRRCPYAQRAWWTAREKGIHLGDKTCEVAAMRNFSKMMLVSNDACVPSSFINIFSLSCMS